MKTKTLSILFALVMVLSLSLGVFAEDSFNETWDEETVLTVFSDLDVVFPDLFADDDTNYLFVDSPMVYNFPKEGDTPVAKDVTLEDLEAKAPIDDGTAGPNKPVVEATFDPCGDGLIKFDVTIYRLSEDDYATAGYSTDSYYGPSKTTYIRELDAIVKVDGTEYSTYNGDAAIRKCTSSGGDNCRSVKFNSKGEAHIKGYLYVPEVLTADSAVTVEIDIQHSTYMTALWEVATEAVIVTDVTTATANTKKDYCQDSIVPFAITGGDVVRARYDQNTGEARFQATVANKFGSFTTANYVIPAEVRDYLGNRYTDYTCKYTAYNTANAAPRTDYCKFGEGIRIAPNGVIRFDITIDHLSSSTLLDADGGDIPFTFRVGGMKSLIDTGIFEAVDYPCPVVTRMSVMDPLKPFMTFYGMESDGAIEASGAYGVYEGGVWGLYQKCGKYAFMAVRLKNDGVKDEVVNLSNVAVAVNGGTVSDWKWVLTSVDEDPKGKITLEPGMDVILFLRAKVTDMPAQLNSDAAMTGAVNFMDYGFYITGKVYSDHNNTNCVAP